MKKLLIIGVAICSLSVSATAQGFGNLKGKKTASAVDTTKKTGTQTVAPSTAAPAVTPSNNSNVAAPKPTKTVDTTIVGGFGEVVPKSLRNETVSDRKTNRSKNPLEYEYLREDDFLYSEFIWREIDAREKMNQSFIYPGKDNTGDQRFFSILLSAIQNDSVAAFSAEDGDDRFTKQLAYDDVTKMMKGKLDTILVQNASFPNVYDTTVIFDTKFAPNPDSIYTFRLKEQWIFDKEASRLFCRIIGIAPVAKIMINNKPTTKTLFWVYYPDLRKTLNKYMVYNPKNYAGRMTWEELFESRFFSSYIVKSSNNNPNEKFLSQIIKNPLFRLLEGENIKERIFNYEQDLWSY
jgi:gliding motility associated protien GldN